jgi:exodeoxyribonuclease V alpha subunit
VLSEIFRQAGESGIVKNAHLINKGLLPDLSEKTADFFFLKRPSADKTAETIIELCAQRLPGNMASTRPRSRSSPRRVKTFQARRASTRACRRASTRQRRTKKEKTFGGTVFREGDRVMQIRNNYDINMGEGPTALPPARVFSTATSERSEKSTSSTRRSPSIMRTSS